MRTEVIISSMERQARCRRRKRIIWKIKQEAFRFVVQLVAATLFLTVLIPLMENINTRFWLELGAGFVFTLWLGEKMRTYRKVVKKNG